MRDTCRNKGTIYMKLFALDGPPRIQSVGTWSRSAGLEVPKPQMYERRSNMSGVTLINGVTHFYPMTILSWEGEGDNKKIVNMTGVLGSIANTLKDVSAQTYTYPNRVSIPL